MKRSLPTFFRFLFLSSALFWLSAVGVAKAEISLPYEPNSLRWPVDLQSPNNLLGNVLAQYQHYYDSQNRYFHGGCDLVVNGDDTVFSPVSGRVEAGYYNYRYPEHGHPEKIWHSLGSPQAESSDFRKFMTGYFEVAIIDDNGFRFELHHIDRDSVSAELFRRVKTGEKILAGTPIGKVYDLGMKTNGQNYKHIHYNIISPEGLRVNCEWVSESLNDTISPSILAVYALYEDGKSVKVESGSKIEKPLEFAVQIEDIKNDNPFIHQPHIINIKFDSNTSFEWDFSKSLSLPDSSRPNLFDFFVEKIELKSGEIIETTGDYKNFIFLNRLPVAEGVIENYEIQVQDANGNRTSFSGSFK